MPQVDLARGGSGGDGRVTCETLFFSSSDDDAPPPDQPVESFYLSRDQEFDWVDRNAYYERKESHKGNSNTKLQSQRFSSSARTKPSTLIGLTTPQTSNFHDPKNRRTVKPGNTRFFPKRLGSAGKFSLRLTEPSSPTVSCMGKVRSNRCKWKPGANVSKPKKTGFWSSFKQMLKIGGSKKKHAVDVSVDKPSEKSSRSRNNRISEIEKEREAPANPPGLGGMNRFVSGRRSDSWAGDALGTEDSYGPRKVV